MEHTNQAALNLGGYEGYRKILALQWLSTGTFFRSECLKPARETATAFRFLSPLDLLRGRESLERLLATALQPFGSVLGIHVVAENSSPDDIDGGKLGVGSRAITNRRARRTYPFLTPRPEFKKSNLGRASGTVNLGRFSNTAEQ